MPHKYEREIEEILKNMERTEPQSGHTDRVRAFQRPPTRARRPAPPRVRLQLPFSEALLGIGIVLALLGAGIAYLTQSYQTQTYAYVSGGVAIAAFVAIVVGLARAWSERFAGPRRPAARPTWQGNIVDATPLIPRRRNPFSAIATQMRILQLKIRYWRSRGK